MRFLAGLAALLSLLCIATNAFAHASLVATEPRDGSMLAQAPKTVQLRFNEPITPAVIRLIDSDGTARDDAVVHAVGDTIAITLPDGLPRGTQVISYRVISADGHPVAGSMMFSVGMGKSGAVPAASDSVVATLVWLARIGLYLGLFVGVGGVFFEAWIAAARVRSGTIVQALALGLFSAVVSLGCQGLDLLGLPLSGILTAAPWQAAIATTLGPSLAVAAAAIGLGFLAQRSPAGNFARAASVLAMTGIGVALASSGHAGTAPPQWLTRPAVFLHAVGVAYWVGALVPLLAMLHQKSANLIAVLHRFSRGAVPVVGGLVLTGIALAIVQLESFHALIDTQYGWILSIKVALVILLLGIAALNRFRLTPVLASDRKNTQPLARSVLFECAIVIGVLAVVAGWRFTPPPRSLAAAVGPQLALHIHSDKAMLQVLVSSGKPGIDSFVLQIMAGDASPLQAKQVTLILSLPEKGIEPMERKATLAPDGNWTVRDMPIPFAGRWRVRVEALVTDFEKVTLEDQLDVPPR
ncbi:copper resistance CopC/CopD family protein [Bradyrhizobium sp.]|jgi:copper transport protein|uniref:copper resistance CopC/CopD family protein n=1 Tax=Bradyrhizobium sp. TaxID=376 RepID=UPI002DFCF637|nr:CopD family protein [Bradyrhizobium sp.]